MGSWKFRKPEPANVRGLCVVCKVKPQKTKGGGKFSSQCSYCQQKRFKRTYKPKDYTRPYVKHKKKVCERCGFVPENTCQLDVHHIDENRSNNDPANLKTLCANCHRLQHAKTPPARASGVSG